MLKRFAYVPPNFIAKKKKTAVPPVTAPVVQKKKAKEPTPKKIKNTIPQLTVEEIALSRANKAERAYLWLRGLSPFLFGERTPTQPKPMAIGLHKQIKAIWQEQSASFKSELAYRSVKYYLDDWVKQPAYRRACSITGAPRYGLEGEVIGSISEKEALLAQEKLAFFN
ncbi:ProQ/FINO family protein [Shewanella colwelliana]|uniref:ProQ/FINO family protein n=1 Tax=Shewanella colwelliana TaxID=23 RepID=UPI003735153D